MCSLEFWIRKFTENLISCFEIWNKILFFKFGSIFESVLKVFEAFFNLWDQESALFSSLLFWFRCRKSTEKRISSLKSKLRPKILFSGFKLEPTVNFWCLLQRLRLKMRFGFKCVPWNFGTENLHKILFPAPKYEIKSYFLNLPAYLNQF